MEVKEPESKFVKIECPECKNKQIIFGKAAEEINCLVCGKKLAESKGGKTDIKVRILEILE